MAAIFAYGAGLCGACWGEANPGAAMLPATRDRKVRRLNMAFLPAVNQRYGLGKRHVTGAGELTASPDSRLQGVILRLAAPLRQRESISPAPAGRTRGKARRGVGATGVPIGPDRPGPGRGVNRCVVR